MAEAWQIDALDARGGIAFASWRDSSLIAENDTLRDFPSVILAPPLFQPEPVGSRAFARGANRGSFQLGFFIAETEIRFATLEALSDFVRRVFLGSGGSDGSDGGGTPLPPPTEGGSGLPPLPEPSPSPEGESVSEPRSPSPSADVLQLIASFKSQVDNVPADLGLIQGTPVNWDSRQVDASGEPGTDDTLSAPTLGKLTQPPDVLGWAALVLIHELLSRVPQSLDHEAWNLWERSARMLGSIIGRLGLWDWLFEHQAQDLLKSWAHFILTKSIWTQIHSRWHRFNGHNYRGNGRIIFHLIFGSVDYSRSDPDDDYFWHFFFDGPHGWGPWGGGWSPDRQSSPIDPLAVLKRIPLPVKLAPAVSENAGNDPSLFHLLVAASASPAVLPDTRAFDSAALLMFAAAIVTLTDDTSPISFGFQGIHDTDASSLWSWRVERLVATAWGWLAASLPQFAFPSAIEEAIMGAGSLRYRADPP